MEYSWIESLMQRLPALGRRPVTSLERIMNIPDWSAQLELGIPAMDSAHKAFFEELAQLAITPDEQFGAVFFLLVAKLERDFEEEEDLMERINFPALNSHREQHARILSGLHHVVPQVMNGEIGAGREAIAFLQEWFMVHLMTMDLALAVALDLDAPGADPAAVPPVHTNPDAVQGQIR